MEKLDQDVWEEGRELFALNNDAELIGEQFLSDYKSFPFIVSGFVILVDKFQFSPQFWSYLDIGPPSQ